MPYYDATIQVAVRGQDRKEALKRLMTLVEQWPANVRSMRHDEAGESIDFVDDVAAWKATDAENVHKLAAFDELLAAAEEMHNWAMVITLGESPGHPLPKLRAAIKRARSA